MDTGGTFHYELPEPQVDEMGNMVQAEPVELMELKHQMLFLVVQLH